jgi:hypothetical protein
MRVLIRLSTAAIGAAVFLSNLACPVSAEEPAKEGSASAGTSPVATSAEELKSDQNKNIPEINLLEAKRQG